MFGELEVLVINDTEYFPATDVARTLDYKEPHKAVTAHCDLEGAGGITYPVRYQSGTKEKRFITIGNVSRLIVAASRQSKNPFIKEKAKQYERWIFDEVIPSIHKHGAYMTPQTINALLQDPDLIIGLASQLKEEQQARRLAERTIEKQKPKVLFAEALEVSETSILVGELSKLLKQNGIPIGQNKLFEWLRENGYLCKKKGEMYNLPTEYSMNLKLFEIKKRTVNNPDGSLRTTRTPKVTGKGQVYFINKFLTENQTA
ncbi:phage repressor protein/antirepressor Ant [Bacillus thuringiensis]|uniref:phage antirepressor n=1 Tax=Bacillus thuringiensis TaxID=1428 RepID=UPI00333B2582